MPAKRYDELPVDKWNTRHFIEYLADEHRKHFGVAYQPQGGYQREVGMLAQMIGTAKKSGQYDKAVVKAWIDACLAEYTPSRQYPGIAFGFMYAYKRNILQRCEIEHRRKANETKTDDSGWEGVDEWL